ncbi:hypothetical protein [Fredinandcohnia sp. 179-A 10B2 NHS]|uniref:hypothetical protein n=1 Tax=Fredinandcohnia sp. 179-A 10B2 NHS TaxID=3235176 RepID=UPI0039A34ED5
MRKWRVGSVSMGLSLIMLGILLFLSQLRDTQMFEPLLVWWPLILVVLGIEIVLYLFLSKQEHPIVKYDLLSIFFVGIIGTIGIGFTLLASTGLVDEVQAFLGAEHRTIDLPEVEEQLPTTIKRIVLETNSSSTKIESSLTSNLHVFGTYQATVDPKGKPVIASKNDYVFTKVVGETMYITIKDPSNHSGPFNTYTTLDPTIVIPASVRLEVRGEHNRISLYPGSVENHWVVDGGGHVDVYVSKENNVLLSATSNSDLQNGTINWDELTRPESNNSEEVYGDQSNIYKGTLKLGDGTYQLSILNCDSVSVNLVEKM